MTKKSIIRKTILYITKLLVTLKSKGPICLGINNSLKLPHRVVNKVRCWPKAITLLQFYILLLLTYIKEVDENKQSKNTKTV